MIIFLSMEDMKMHKKNLPKAESSLKNIKIDEIHEQWLPIVHGSQVQDMKKTQLLESQRKDIDLACSTLANVRKYYEIEKVEKEQKTVETSEKVFKHAAKKTNQALKEFAVATNITETRKVMWFEKFLWFISSENYLVIVGRDDQQNELIVNRHMKTNDLYVHADLHGANSLIIKNPKGSPVPPKTLKEAGIMVVCNSSAWSAKVRTSPWWVHSNQVSKLAPAGACLTTGSFIIHGKKNYIAPAPYVMGFSFMFRLDEESYKNHIDERYVHVDETESELNKENSRLCNCFENEDASKIGSATSSNLDENESVKDTKLFKHLKEETLDNKADGCNDLLQSAITFSDIAVKLDVLSGSLKTDRSKSKAAVDDNTEGIIILQHKKKIPTNVPYVDKNEHNNSGKDQQSNLKHGWEGKMKFEQNKINCQDEEAR